jgi:O-antigen/teichoic acid export membrane protein
LRGRSLLRVGKNAFARLSAQAWGRALSLVLVALVARHEGSGGLGRYVLVLTVVGIAGELSDLGLSIFLTREAVRYVERERQTQLLGIVLPLKGVLAIAGYLGLVIVAHAVRFPPATRQLLLIGGLSLLPDGVMGAMAALINARRRMEVTGLLSVAVRLLTLAGALAALASGYGVAGVLGGTVVASVLGALLHGAVLRRWQLLPRCTWSSRIWRACIAESYPFALTAIIARVYARLDLVLLSLWKGDVAAGWYSAAYKLWEAFGLLPASLLDALFPEMSHLSSSTTGLGRLRSLFRRGGQAMSAAAALLAVVGTLGASALIPLLYGRREDPAPSVATFRLLVWALPAMFLYLLSGHTLYALGQQRRVTVAMLLVGSANVGLNMLVIPRWSYLGAAAVALGSEWLLCCLLYPQARRSLTAATKPILRGP